MQSGQRQRLMIARAIAPKPDILMFDEATSALDNITQKTVSDSLSRLNCTRIVIAHRLSTIRECDRIIVLDGGKIVEEGNYEALMAKGGRFCGSGPPAAGRLLWLKGSMIWKKIRIHVNSAVYRIYGGKSGQCG